MLRTAVSLSLILLPLAPAAHADDLLPPNKVAVSFKDIDFDRPESVEALYKRLQYASKVVCDTQEPEELFRENDNRACERDTVKGAVRDIDRPSLTALDARADAESIALARDRRR
jgi:UrcA family protein